MITKCVENRLPLLSNPIAAEIVIESLAHVRRSGKIKLLAFVVMPDHYHAIFALAPNVNLSELMRGIGSFTANTIRKALGLESVVWQPDGFHDRACRDDAEVLALAEYTEHNPVQRDSRQAPREWHF